MSSKGTLKLRKHHTALETLIPPILNNKMAALLRKIKNGSLPTQRCVTHMLAHEDGIWSLSWSKRCNKIVSGSVDDSVKVWSGVDGELLYNLVGHQLGVFSVDTNGHCKFSLIYDD